MAKIKRRPNSRYAQNQKELLQSRLKDGAKSVLDQIEIDRRELSAVTKDIKTFRKYARGEQETTLTVEQQKILEGVLGNDYCDNACGEILSTHANRLRLSRITCQDDKIQKWLDDFWKRIKADDLQRRTHRSAIRDGNFCLMTDYNYTRDRLCIHRERWWDGFTGVFVGYDVYGDMLYAVKEWLTPFGRRRTVYYEGAIERYISAGGGAWVPFLLPSDIGNISGNSIPGAQSAKSDAIALPYTDMDGEPLHIPFIHFANPGDEFENYGSSILDGGVKGSQDQINDSQYDISAAGRANAFQRSWSKGYKLQIVNKKTVRPNTGPGVHYHAVEPDAAWGVLAAGDMSQLINTYETKLEALFRMTGTPLYRVSGNFPSGEAIFKLEQAIRDKTRERQDRFAPAWVEVFHRCIELENAIENTGLDEQVMLSAVYADAADRDPLTTAMADLSMWQSCLQAVQAGIPLVTFLREKGWSQDQLDKLAIDVKSQIEKNRADLLGGSIVPPGSDPARGKENPTSPTKGKGTNTQPNNAPGNKDAKG